LRWQVGGSTGGTEPRLAGVYFLGTPLAWGSRLYALVELRGAIRLVVLNAETGRLEWTQELALVDQPISRDLFRRMAGASPSISGNVIVCPTSGGGAVAVDLATQSLLWAYQYPRAARSRLDPNEGQAPALEQRDRWLDATATISDGRVLLTPLEADELHCLDLATGKPLWSQARGENLYVAGIQQERVVLIGRTQVSAVRLADGRSAWNATLPLPAGSLPSGRGLVGGGNYYLPLTDASIAQIDLSAGTLTHQLRSPREIVPGNLIWHAGAFISQSAGYLEVFDEAAALEQRTRQRLRENPRDAEALLRLGELEAGAGRYDAGLAHFRAAHAITPGARTRNRLAAALADALRGNPPNHRELSDELDRLLVP
jgi:tetratricopeptide (TPR) repeat protein